MASPKKKAADAAKPAAKAAPARAPQPATKSQMCAHIAEKTGLSKKAVAAVVDTFAAYALSELQTRGVTAIPGIAKLRRVTRPARPERQGINPLTRAPMVIAAQPARPRIRARFLAAFKKGVESV